MNEMKYDVIIVGAGPAGLFAAYELSKENKSVLIIDQGLNPIEREKKFKDKKFIANGNSIVMSGVGGAGLFSDGKLNFIPILGKTDLTQFVDIREAQEIIDYIEKVFGDFKIDGEVYPTDMNAALNYKKIARRHGLDLLLIKQKHIGSDVLPKRINGFMKFLEEKGVVFRTNEKVTKTIVKGNHVMGVETDKEKYYSENVILAPGRIGANWLSMEAKKMKIDVIYKSVEVGVRIEMPAEILDEITSVIYDPTFFIRTKKYDDLVRTFCTNRNGFIAEEKYDGFVCVNGHSYKYKKSDNSNFALLNKINLTEPFTNTLEYGRSIGALSNTIGNGKIILQRFVDLKKNRRSTWKRLSKSYVNPTFKDVTPGDISMALPARIVTNLSESIERLNKIIPGVASDSTLLYAPEIKFFSTQIKTNNYLETSVSGLYVAGDGAGVSGNIVGAAATGIIAARGILKN